MSEVDEFEAMLGESEPAPPKACNLDARFREARLQADIRRAGAGKTIIPEDEFLMPVTMNFLARVLRMDPVTVKDRLRAAGLKPAGFAGAGRPVYMFHEALPYLIKPKMDLGTYIKTLNAADLPNSINKTFWEAERIKNKVLIETGQAWPTAKVLDVLGSVFMTIKDRIPLITEDMREAGLTDEQMNTLMKRVDQFQTDLHAALVDMPKKSQTYSRVTEIDTGEAPPEAFLDDED